MDPVRREELGIYLYRAWNDTKFMVPYVNWLEDEAKIHEFMRWWRNLEQYYEYADDWLMDATAVWVYHEFIRQIDETEWSGEYVEKAKSLKQEIIGIMGRILDAGWGAHPVHSNRRSDYGNFSGSPRSADKK